MKRFIRNPRAVVLIAAFSVIGVSLLAFSSAETPAVSSEVESASLTGNATFAAGGNASGTGSVKFGAGGVNEPYGLAAITNITRLAKLQPTIRAGHLSSYDRNGGNADTNQFLIDKNGEKIMADMRGPGVVYRIWATGFNPTNDWIKVYFDGETIPRINMKMGNFFSGQSSPFLSPLNVPNSVSSGGYVGYLPLPYAKSIKITTNMSNYYNVGFNSLAKDANIASWTGREDSSAARALFANSSKDPHNETTATTSNGTASLAPGTSQTVLDTSGSGQVTSMKLKIPGMGDGRTVTDTGRAHRGTSQFTMKINPASTGVSLVRRMDLSIAYQRATVFVDGTEAGTWFEGGPETNRFFDSTFEVPANLTAGKSSIVVRVQFVSSANDWNEFTYWAYSATDTGVVQTDSLDVGNVDSETAHSYSIGGQSWNGTGTHVYNSADIMNTLRVRMFWDNEKTPSVDAPIGQFFGMGRFGVTTNRSQMMGLDSGGNLYAYFPMPYGQRAVIQLSSLRSTATNGITYEFKRQPLSAAGLDMSQLGYFKTQSHVTAPEKINQDIPLLETSGQGKFIGVVASYTGTPSRWYLEGDERIYVDGASSPSVHGTGTEDFFNGGWYFDRGAFTQPLAGNPANLGSSYSASTVAYRLMTHDSVPFRSHIAVSIEHGGVNETTDNAWTLAYYYHKPNSAMTLTDTLDVGNAASEASHNYSITNPTWHDTATHHYEGLYKYVTKNITDDGRSHKGTSEFNLKIDPTNQGVVMRRRFDQRTESQEADIYVNGQKVGTEFMHAGNAPHRWRDNDFHIPARYTSGKSQITVKVQFISSRIDWNEFTYWAYSLK